MANGDGDFGKWIANLAKAVWYVGVIAGATWAVANFDQRMKNVESGLARIEAQGQDAIHRPEYERIKRAANREHQRLWSAIHRKADAEDLPD